MFENLFQVYLWICLLCLVPLCDFGSCMPAGTLHICNAFASRNVLVTIVPLVWFVRRELERDDFSIRCFEIAQYFFPHPSRQTRHDARLFILMLFRHLISYGCSEYRKFHDHLVSIGPSRWVKLSRYRVQVVCIKWNGSRVWVWCRYAAMATIFSRKCMEAPDYDTEPE